MRKKIHQTLPPEANGKHNRIEKRYTHNYISRYDIKYYDYRGIFLVSKYSSLFLRPYKEQLIYPAMYKDVG